MNTAHKLEARETNCIESIPESFYACLMITVINLQRSAAENSL
jgi:hypothetical protein